MCVLALQIGQITYGPYQQEYEQQIKGSYLFPLTGTGKAAPGLLCPGWCLPAIDECGKIGHI